MNNIQSFANNIKFFYNAINPAVLSGANDVIVVEQPDGSLFSTPFQIRFGKFDIFITDQIYIDVIVNNVKTNVRMKLEEDGSAYFTNQGSGPVVAQSLQHLSSDQLQSLQLHSGKNEAKFIVTTKFQGTSYCGCQIYLFKYSDILVISEIDATITKSDVLGYVIAAMGGTWAHEGVAELYTRIQENGYKMVYLSSRAIGQSHFTKKYLQSLTQDSQTLPDGPMLLYPGSPLDTFRLNVIEERPEELKIGRLLDLKRLFPGRQPFYAAFGKRKSDVLSYATAEIPDEQIFIINHASVVRRADDSGFSSTYSLMAAEMVDNLFPPLHHVAEEGAEAEVGQI